jgi:hypothetical protein
MAGRKRIVEVGRVRVSYSYKKSIGLRNSKCGSRFRIIIKYYIIFYLFPFVVITANNINIFIPVLVLGFTSILCSFSTGYNYWIFVMGIKDV